MKNNILLQGLSELQKKDKDIDFLVSQSADKIISLLEQYIAQIELFNPAYGLVGVKTTEELIIKHILDSLAPLGIICRLLKDMADSDIAPLVPPLVADIGSGAGLPGIPLSIAMSNWYPKNNEQPPCFCLVERMGRRAGFLLNTIALLSAANVTVEETDFENISQKFNLITFRAFKPLEPKLLKGLLKILAQGGCIAAYKGRHEKIEEEIAQLKTLPVFDTIEYQIIPYSVPFLNEDRHLLVISNSK